MHKSKSRGSLQNNDKLYENASSLVLVSKIEVYCSSLQNWSKQSSLIQPFAKQNILKDYEAY